MDPEKKKILYSLIFPVTFVALMWIIKLFEVSTHTSLYFLGIYPLHWKGLIGILTAPLIHENWSHLMANSGPMIILGGVIFYFYKRIAWFVFFLIYLITGIWVWVLARDAYHIGASGVVYGMASFVFTSGILRKDNRLLAVSMLVVFLYGGLVWGVFPQLFPDKNISWESHLMGLLAGVVVAYYYRNFGPPKKVYDWENEDDDNIEVPEWYPEEPPQLPEDEPKPINTPNPAQPQGYNYIYKENPPKD